MYPCEYEPYQFVPSATNVKMSILPTVAVMVGAPEALNFTPVNVAVVAVPEAGCLSSKMNDLPAVAVGMVNVHAVAEVSVAVSTVPAVIARVAVEPTVPLATMVSVYAAMDKLPGMETVPALSIRILSVAPVIQR